MDVSLMPRVIQVPPQNGPVSFTCNYTINDTASIDDILLLIYYNSEHSRESATPVRVVHPFPWNATFEQRIVSRRVMPGDAGWYWCQIEIRYKNSLYSSFHYSEFSVLSYQGERNVIYS